MCLQGKKGPGLTSFWAKGPGCRVNNFPLPSWDSILEVSYRVKVGGKKTFFKPLEGISAQTMLDMDRVLKELQGIRKTTHISTALNSPFPRRIHPTAVRMLHPGSKSPWHFYPASRLPTKTSSSFFQIICCVDHSVYEWRSEDLMVLGCMDQGHTEVFREKLNKLISLILWLWVCQWLCDLEKVALPSWI